MSPETDNFSCDYAYDYKSVNRTFNQLTFDPKRLFVCLFHFLSTTSIQWIVVKEILLLGFTAGHKTLNTSVS